MKVINGQIVLSEMSGCSPSLGEYSYYTDTTGNKVVIPNRLIVSLYELLKHEAKKQGIAFNQFEASLYPDTARMTKEE